MTLDSSIVERAAMWMIVAGVAVALLRLSLRTWKLHGSRPRIALGWLAGLFLLQVGTAFLLWSTLFPPAKPLRAETLTVLTARAPPDAARSGPGHVVALPEAGNTRGMERVVDLGAALRRYPETRRVRVFGAGLVARDRDAARRVVVEFVPTALPEGLVQLQAPVQVAQGAPWKVQGRVAGMQSATVQLRDPAGGVVARGAISPDGRFELSAMAGVPGRSEYALRLSKGGRRAGDDIAVPIEVVEGERVRVLLLAGAPGPETKFLRRWAADAGLDLRSEIRLGARTSLESTTDAFSEAGRFGDADLVVLDERAWRALGEGGRGELLQAARAGTGVLLRVSGTLAADDLARLRPWGFATAVRDARPASAATGGERAPRSGALSLRPPGVVASDGVELRDPRDGSVLGSFRSEGRGRIALWWAVDTYRRVLAGDAPGHGALWSRAVAELARRGSAPGAPAALGSPMRVGQRVVLCGADTQAQIESPDGTGLALVMASARQQGPVMRCGAFWPRVRGWHLLRSDEGLHPFHVRGAREAAGLFAWADRDATLQLSALASPPVAAQSTTAPQARWPWLLGWLAASLAFWWLERASARTGIVAPVAPVPTGSMR